MSTELGKAVKRGQCVEKEREEKRKKRIKPQEREIWMKWIESNRSGFVYTVQQQKGMDKI